MHAYVSFLNFVVMWHDRSMMTVQYLSKRKSPFIKVIRMPDALISSPVEIFRILVVQMRSICIFK
jgi:hypothetical protein